MKNRKMHKKYRAWKLQGHMPVLATMLCALYPELFMVLVVIFAIIYDVYLLWLDPKFALLRRKPDDFKFKKIITVLVSFFGLASSILITTGNESNAITFICLILMFLVTILDNWHYLELFTKGFRK